MKIPVQLHPPRIFRRTGVLMIVDKNGHFPVYPPPVKPYRKRGHRLEIKNSGKSPIDVILFGGEPYNEPIVSEENFVMNNPHEISQAYNDYYEGKYGQIKPKQKN